MIAAVFLNEGTDPLEGAGRAQSRKQTNGYVWVARN
jgi:hypothetical protein